MNKKIVVFISGSGTNLQAMIDAQKAGKISGEICGVFCNKPEAYGLERAKNAGIPTFVFERKDFGTNLEMDNAIAKEVEKLDADLIVLAGYMKILTAEFTQRFDGKILNIHPSLLPKYAGLNTHQRAMEAGDSEHGISIHFVNEEMDGGAIVLQAKIALSPADTIEEVIERVYEKEHQYYPEVVEWFCQDRLVLKAGIAYLDGEQLDKQGVQV